MAEWVLPREQAEFLFLLDEIFSDEVNFYGEPGKFTSSTKSVTNHIFAGKSVPVEGLEASFSFALKRAEMKAFFKAAKKAKVETVSFKLEPGKLTAIAGRLRFTTRYMVPQEDLRARLARMYENMKPKLVVAIENAGDLIAYIKSASEVADGELDEQIVVLEAKSGKLTATVYAPTGDRSKVGSIEMDLPLQDFRCCYGMQLFTEALSLYPDDEGITLRLDSDMPIMIEQQVGNAYGACFLAPRIED